MAKKNTNTTAPEVEETQVVAPEATVEVTDTEVVAEVEVEAAPEVNEAEVTEILVAVDAARAEEARAASEVEEDFTLVAPATLAHLKALAANITINSNGSEQRTGGRLVQNLTTDTLGLLSLTELLTLVKAL